MKLLFVSTDRRFYHFTNMEKAIYFLLYWSYYDYFVVEIDKDEIGFTLSIRK